MEPPNVVPMYTQIGTDVLPKNPCDVDNFITFGVANTFTYTNHRGETAERHVTPLYVWFGDCKCDPEAKEQWILQVYDLDRKDFRSFALSKIQPR